MKYVALLRGINVGGNAKVPMAELRQLFEAMKFTNVSTYINSGNVLFVTDEQPTDALARSIEKQLLEAFGFSVSVVVVAATKYTSVMADAPKWWGEDPAWKHNLVFMLEPYDMQAVVEAVGELKPAIEKMHVGDGVLFQSMSFDQFGKTTTGKLAAKPVYKQMTIRNFNTAQKLQSLLSS